MFDKILVTAVFRTFCLVQIYTDRYIQTTLLYEYTFIGSALRKYGLYL